MKSMSGKLMGVQKALSTWSRYSIKGQGIVLVNHGNYINSM